MMDTQKLLSNENFHLASAIFVPFHGISADRIRPKDRDAKLRRILEDLDKQHDAVRRNMMYLVTLQKEKLVSNAREALEKDKEINESLNSEPKQADHEPLPQQSVKKLLDRLKEPGVKGTNGKEYEYEEGDFEIPEIDRTEGFTDASSDATMGGVEGGTPCSAKIRQELSCSLQELVLRAASELESYDKHAEATKDYYRKALQRHTARESTIPDSACQVGGSEPLVAVQMRERLAGGILKNRNAEIRIDTEALARMAEEDQSFSSNQARSAVDISRDPRRSSVDSSRVRRRNSVDISKDLRRASLEESKDVWRR